MSYHAIPEDWAGFRNLVVDATNITERQRVDLLALIDRPAASPIDYDRKESELRTSAEFAQLYHDEILPYWFPELRYIRFRIDTKLKHLPVDVLRNVARLEPHLMSLNNFFDVAASYDKKNADFRYTLMTALVYYPDNAFANTYAAYLALDDGNYALAEKYISKVGDNDEANNIRGIIETYKGNYFKARAFFMKAPNQKESQHNLKLMEEY